MNNIKVGDLVKKKGMVTYADGERMKISRKTWLVSKVEGDQVFYNETAIDDKGNEVVRDIPLLTKGSVELFVFEEEEIKNKAKVLTINPGTVAENYRVLKTVEQYNWQVGEIVQIVGKVSFDTLEKGYLEKVGSDEKHQHMMIVADSIKAGLAVNN